jgi:hypothetical protein
MEQIKERLISIKKNQENWKHEAIDIAIEAINGWTHRDKEYHIKKLMMHLKSMPEITERDYGEESEDFPF